MNNRNILKICPYKEEPQVRNAHSPSPIDLGCVRVPSCLNTLALLALKTPPPDIR